MAAKGGFWLRCLVEFLFRHLALRSRSFAAVQQVNKFHFQMNFSGKRTRFGCKFPVFLLWGVCCGGGAPPDLSISGGKTKKSRTLKFLCTCQSVRVVFLSVSPCSSSSGLLFHLSPLHSPPNHAIWFWQGRHTHTQQGRRFLGSHTPFHLIC